MDLSSLVHPGKTQLEPLYQQNNHQVRRDVTASQSSNAYLFQGDNQKSMYSCVSTPQPPPSPPADETPRCSLPSISSLLGLVDNSRPQEPSQTMQQYGHNRDILGSKINLDQTSKSSYFELGHNQYSLSQPINPRSCLPLTPPLLNSDSGFDGSQSLAYLTNISKNTASSSPPSIHELVPNISMGYSLVNHSKLSNTRHRTQSVEKGDSVSAQEKVSYSRRSANYSDEAYRMSSRQRLASFHSTSIPKNQSTQPQAQTSGLIYQRPLPQQFSSSSMQIPSPKTQSPSENLWQHHHYISPSSAASFPQTQDRYICQTCNKAFSRPSSLLIHSHSHTGAKPFKCPYAGCGKAFSVRSNMKRHERGCHNSECLAIS